MLARVLCFSFYGRDWKLEDRSESFFYCWRYLNCFMRCSARLAVMFLLLVEIL